MEYKRILLIFVLFVCVFEFGFANVQEDCFEVLNEKYSFDFSYQEFRKEVDNSQFAPLTKSWVNLDFIEPIYFVKLYHFGERSVFKYDFMEFEKGKVGSMEWPNNYEFQVFEQYLKNPVTQKYEFMGCGFIEMIPRGSYTLKNLTNDANFRINTNNWRVDYNIEDDKILFEQFAPGFDINKESSVDWNSFIIFYKNDELFFNEGDLIPYFTKSVNEYKNGNIYLYVGFEKYVLEKYPKLKEHLRTGFISSDNYYNSVSDLKFYALKDLFKYFTDPLAQEFYLRNRNELNVSYSKVLLLNLNFTQTNDLFEELYYLDGIFFDLDLFEIEKSCLDIQNVSCIGERITNELLKYSGDNYSINVLVDLYLTENNPFYNFSNEVIINDYIKNKYLIFDSNNSERLEKKLLNLNNLDYVNENTIFYSLDGENGINDKRLYMFYSFLGVLSVVLFLILLFVGYEIKKR